jgi:hypothetical protein
MKFRARKHSVAWLGLMAMWLVVFAPLISQLIVAAVAARADVPNGTICSAVKSEEHARTTRTMRTPTC